MWNNRNLGDRTVSGHFYQRIHNLRLATLIAGKQVGMNLARAVLALQNRQTAIAREVIGAEWAMEGLAHGIHSSYLHAMGSQRLSPREIRLLSLGLEVARKLIGMSRMVISIARRAIELSEESHLKPLLDIPRMAELGRKTLEMNLKSFLEAGGEGPAAIQDKTETFEQIFEQLLRELATYTLEDPSNVHKAGRLIEIARILEVFGEDAVYVGRLALRVAREGAEDQRMNKHA